MADTAKRLIGPVLLSTSNTTLYTVPASTLTIVRFIHVASSSTSLYNVSLGINGTPATASFAFFSATNVPGNGALDWSGFLPLAAGETLQGFASNGTALTLIVSGVEVTP